MEANLWRNSRVESKHINNRDSCCEISPTNQDYIQASTGSDTSHISNSFTGFTSAVIHKTSEQGVLTGQKTLTQLPHDISLYIRTMSSSCDTQQTAQVAPTTTFPPSCVFAHQLVPDK